MHHQLAIGRESDSVDSGGSAPTFTRDEQSPESHGPTLCGIYRTAADPGLHAAAEWLLRSWHQEAWLRQVNEEWAKDKKQREKRLEEITHDDDLSKFIL